MTRYPLDNLARICEARWRPLNEQSLEFTRRSGKVADVVGVDRACVNKWSRTGLTRDAADRAAAALNLHPAEIWPEWFTEEVAV